MSTEQILGIVSTIFTSLLGILWWLVKKLINDIEKKVGDSQLAITRTQDLADAKIKEKMYDFKKVADALSVEVKDMNKSITQLERSSDVISMMVKNVDENTKEKMAVFTKNTDQINSLVQKLVVMEKEVENFGKVIVKK